MWTNGAGAPEGRRSRETLRKGGREDMIQIEPAAYGGVHVITPRVEGSSDCCPLGLM